MVKHWTLKGDSSTPALDTAVSSTSQVEPALDIRITANPSVHTGPRGCRRVHRTSSLVLLSYPYAEHRRSHHIDPSCPQGRYRARLGRPTQCLPKRTAQDRQRPGGIWQQLPPDPPEAFSSKRRGSHHQYQRARIHDIATPRDQRSVSLLDEVAAAKMTPPRSNQRRMTERLGSLLVTFCRERRNPSSLSTTTTGLRTHLLSMSDTTSHEHNDDHKEYTSDGTRSH